MIQTIKELWHYMRRGRAKFHAQAALAEKRADDAYEGSMASARAVTREARKVHTNADFIREVLKGHG